MNKFIIWFFHKVLRTALPSRLIKLYTREEYEAMNLKQIDKNLQISLNQCFNEGVYPHNQLYDKKGHPLRLDSVAHSELKALENILRTIHD